MSPLEWMAWTTPTAIFFVLIAAMLVFMTLLSIRSPSVARKGVLPMPTTRGDRLYIGLISSALLMLAWLGLSDQNAYFGAGLCALWLAAVLRWG